MIDAGHETFTVANLSKVWVQAEVYEKDLGRIHLGQNAAIKVDTYPDESFSGRVVYISDVLDPQTRTARVRCEVDNQDHRLKTDMFVNVDLPTLSSKQGIAVPSSALQTVEGKTVVFVRHSPTKFEARRFKSACREWSDRDHLGIGDWRRSRNAGRVSSQINPRRRLDGR